MNRLLHIISFILFIFGISLILLFFYFNKEEDINVTFNDYRDNIVILNISSNSNDLYCAISNDKDLVFKKVVNSKCEYELKEYGSYDIYIKDKNKITKYDITRVLSINVLKDTYYLALYDTSK